MPAFVRQVNRRAVLKGAAALSAAVACPLVGLALLFRRVRRHGTGGQVLGPFEELWHPAAARSRVQVQEQVQQAAPSPGSGAPPRESR